MITRCPACQTAFRVSDAQLAARDGQVRCGACAHIFDARAFLVADTTPTPAAADDATVTDEAKYEAFVPDMPGESTVPEAPQAHDAVADAYAQKADSLATDHFSGPAAQGDGPAPAGASPTAHPPSFDFGPAAPARALRGPWIAASLALLLLLAAQSLFHFRNDIALLVPDAKPLLKDACSLLGCSISLPRRSELMSIEASDLQADGANPNVVVLTATLRNRALFAQAHPALELTLTDAQDLPLARRVLLAADYLDDTPDKENGFAAGAERAIKLTLQLADIKATGYRLYLFYP